MVGGSDLVKQKEQLGDDGKWETCSIYCILWLSCSVNQSLSKNTRDLCIYSYYGTGFVIIVIVLDMFDYVFPENGLIAYKNGSLIGHTVSRCVQPNWGDIFQFFLFSSIY